MATKAKKKTSNQIEMYDDRVFEHPRIVLDSKGNPKVYPPGSGWRLEDYTKEYIEHEVEALKREKAERQRATRSRKTKKKVTTK